MFKRVLSILLALTFLVGAVAVAPVSAGAEETNSADTIETTTEDVEVSGTNSVGDMIADEYDYFKYY